MIQGEIVSGWFDMFIGAPQGSVIGLLLFSIFENDQPGKLLNVIKLYSDEI